MTPHSTSLEAEFVTDHRTLTQTISRLLDALRSGRDAEAMQIADELDTLAGPHIAFEESVMYPEVARHTDAAFAQRLYEEHRIALRGVRRLLEHREQPELSPEERTKIMDDLQTGLDHVVSCGRLLSHLTVLDEKTQRQYLDQLIDLRHQGTRWTALRPRP